MKTLSSASLKLTSIQYNGITLLSRIHLLLTGEIELNMPYFIYVKIKLLTHIPVF